jgi:6-phosphogluconolactonase
LELITAPIAELRTRITKGFEEAVAAILNSGAAVPPVVSDDEGKRVKAEPKRFTCGLTGGSTGLIFLGALRGATVSWSQITLYWGDERAVPPDHDDSNCALAERLLLSPLGARAPFVERMRGEAEDLRAAARDYDERLPAALDLIILGVGDDGHVCSLFPGHPALMIEDERVIVIEDAPKPPPRRLTLSLPYVCASRRVWVVAVGPRKLPVLQAAISANALNTPLDIVVRRAREVTIFTDQSLRKGFVAV